MKGRIVRAPYGTCAAVFALMALGGCSFDRSPEFANVNRNVYAGDVPLPSRSVSDVPASTGGGTGSGPGQSSTQLTGGLQCGGVFCPFTQAPLMPCCTGSDDVAFGAARAVDLCGVDFSATSGAFSGSCWERNQPGVVDDSCADYAPPGGVAEAGCCTNQGKCGTFNSAQGLGCHYPVDGSEPASCSDEDIDTGRQCEPTGVFGIEAEIDVSWGGRSGGLAALTDDGRDTIVIHLRATIDGVAPDGEAGGEIRVCGVQLPPFYSTTLCESYAPIFPDEMWESPDMPTYPLSGRYQCLSPGCILSLDAQNSLLGIELQNPEAPWPTAADTAVIECASGSGAECFPDHDADGLPGLSVNLLTSGMAPPGVACGGDYAFNGAPLSANPAAIFGGVRRSDNIFLGTRVRLGGSGKIDASCDSGIGAGVAEFVQSRSWGCVVQEGTFNFGEPPAGPGEPCTATEAAFLDENLPIYYVLPLGARPDPSLEVVDESVSEGPIFRLTRLGELGDDVSCEAVRDAVYP
jgi:hypothetical protein